MTKNVFIHLGFPKTASTFLQREFFSKHLEIDYFGKPFSKEMKEIYNSIINDSRKNFDKKKNKFRKFLKKKIYSSNKKAIIISQEGFSNPILWKYINDQSQTIYRINSLFINLKINLNYFYFTRKYSELIPSYYLQSAQTLRQWPIYDNELIGFFKFKIENKETKNIDTKTKKYWENNELFFQNRREYMVKNLILGFDQKRYYKILRKYLKKKQIKIFKYDDLTLSNFYKKFCKFLKISTFVPNENKVNTSEEKYLIYKKKKILKRIFDNFLNPKKIISKNIFFRLKNLYKLFIKQDLNEYEDLVRNKKLIDSFYKKNKF